MAKQLEWTTVQRKPNDLVPLEINPRKITEAKRKKLIESLEKFNLAEIPAINKDNTVIAGNQRLKALQLMGRGDELIDVRMPNRKLTQKELKEYALIANTHAGEWDMDIFEEFFQDVNLEDMGLSMDDFKMPEMGDLVDDTEPEVLEAQEDDFEVPEENQIQTDIVVGDLIEIGEHRLLCGDSTDSDAVAKLMNGDKANLCFTSPPYWVGKSYEYQESEKEIDDFITAIANVICLNTKVGFGRIVINTGTAAIHRIDKKRKVEILPLIDKWQISLRKHGWLMRHLRIWMKRGGLPACISPKTDVIDQHNEYIAEFEHVDFENDYSQITTFWNPNGEQRGQERVKDKKWAQQGVWDDVHGEMSAGGKHIAAFPVEIAARNILLYSKKEELLYEPFTGSGTTMVAAHQLKRRCYGMELDPKYCQVIVDRMLKLDPTLTIKRNGELWNTTASS